ncbi:MAG: VCBS repeat-containing protein [Oscillochloris sp.]|nr:VCBS repeat-containing protein [Oscillochloris sp.]
MDGDGDLDLVFFLEAVADRVRLNDGSGTMLAGITFGDPADANRDGTVADMDGDGDLDILAANNPGAIKLYLNNNTAFTSPINIGSGGFERISTADLDNNGRLDVIAARFNNETLIFFNDAGPSFTRSTTIRPPDAVPPEFINYNANRVGDLDGDGDLDIVSDAFVFFNNGAGVMTSQALPAEFEGVGRSVLGDLDGDGDLDIVTGRSVQINEVLLNNGDGSFVRPDPPLTFDALYGPAAYMSAVDIDGDGDLDMVLGLDGFPFDGVFLNDGSGKLTRSRTLGSAQSAVGDMDGDGRFDIIDANNISFNRPGSLPEHINNPPTVSIERPGSTANAPAFSSPQVLSGPVIDVNYALTDPEGDAIKQVLVEFSLDGGSNWQPAVPAAGTDTSDLAAAPTGSAYVFRWDTFASGVFGQSDNVVLRMRALPSTLPGVNQVGGAPRQAYASATTFPFRVRGSQVRVVQANNSAGANAIVYRIPAGQTVGSAIAASNGTAYTTDAQGFLPGRGTLNVGDELIALLPVETTPKFTRYRTSAAVGATGPNPFSVSQPGVQTLTIGQGNPLLAINLAVSLEWDARKDTAYLDQLKSDLRRSSELLYTWSDGQIVLGEVTIYHDKVNWATADVQIHAGNALRPNANQGGIVRVDTPDPTIAGLTYETGQIRMGAVWTRFGDASGQEGEDWPRAFAHELGHWALFLDEDYLGFGEDNSLITVEGCPGPMADPYRNDYGQFRADTPAACQPTLNQQVSGRSNWATIKAFYDTAGWTLNAPASFAPNSGPSFLPFEVTTIREVLPATSTDALLAVPILSLQTAGGTRYLASGGAKAILFSADGNRITDLGLPERGEVVARGASIGDRLCVFDLDEQVLGCETISAGDLQLTMVAKTGWQPELLVTPITSSTYQLRVDNLPAGLNLKAKLYASEGNPSPEITLARSGEAYTASVNLAEPILSGALQVWVEESGTRREVVTDYALGGNPAPPRKPKKRKSRNAPALSPDGQVVLFSDNLNFNPGSYFAIQSLTSLPIPAPAWSVPVGFGYRLLASANAPSLIGTSLNMSYLESDVVPGTEGGIGMYYLAEGGTQWQRLVTRLDPRVNEISAAALGPGTYLLMSSTDLRLGWNLLSYPWPEPTVALSDGLALLGGDGAYSTIYGYDPSDSADPWKVYDTEVPNFVNDLSAFRYGRGYWVRATADAVTAGLKQSAGLDQAVSPERPTTFYAIVPNGNAGQPVEARIGNTLCATTTTRSADGQVVFVLDVPANAERAGCGVRDAVVEVRVNGQAFGAAFWEGERPQEIRLGDTAERRLFLPFIVR